jgi:Tol biopolymer transport system component
MSSRLVRFTISAAGLLLCAPLSAQVTQRVSVDSAGAEGNAESESPAISQNGRFVVFSSFASNLVAGDTNNSYDVFVRDRWTGTTERVSVSSSGVEGNADSGGSNAPVVSISADGRYVAFASLASNLVANDMNGVRDVFIRDRQSGTTERLLGFLGSQMPDAGYNLPTMSADGRYVAFESDATLIVLGDTNMVTDAFVADRQNHTVELVSVATDGTQGNFASGNPRISADGRYVALESYASNLDATDTNGFKDVFVRDRQSGTTEIVSLTSGGAAGDDDSFDPAISADGRFVSFSSDATNLVAGDTNADMDVFVHDRRTGTTERVSVLTGGAQGNSFSWVPAISADGRFVAFDSYASNLVAGDTNGCHDIFVRDRQSGTTERVSVATGGGQGNNQSYFPSISADGRYVAFESNATNLVPGDTNGFGDVFIRDRQSGTTARVSVDSVEGQGNSSSAAPSISANGRYVAFDSVATNLIPGDTNGSYDVFVRDRLGGTRFTSQCSPGLGGVIGCPCSNPPGGPGRGCDNSVPTGGAILSAAGGTFLSSDSLVFTTSGEKPTATSILLQGTSSAVSGVVYGQGVRCVGGNLKRLYVKSASSGSITAPNFGAGDPPVSARSAAKGDTILPGQDRWYLVYYRDPIVPGGCPASSTFNATQTGLVTWSP